MSRKTAQLLAGTCALALAVGSSSALAGTYHATDATTLFNAINAANADPDPTATVVFDNDISAPGSNLPGTTKPITIDTNGHTYSQPWFDNSAGVGGVVNLNGTPTGSNYIFKGNYQGATIGAGASGNGDPALFSNAGKTFENDGTMTGGAGGGLGGNGATGVGISQISTFTNTGTVTGGSAVNGTGGFGASGSLGANFINTGTITGGDGSVNGGSGIRSGGSPSTPSGVTNSGTIKGGNSTTGAGGDGVTFTPGRNSLTNTGTIIGGDGVTGGWGVNFTGIGTFGTLTNNGTIKGGNGSSAPGGVSGAGVIVHAGLANFINTGTITGGAGGAAVTNSGAAVSLVNSGTLNAGTGSTTAIFMSGAQALTLELDKGSVINGNVVGFAGQANTLILGGTANASFDVSTVGLQYQNFTSYQKTGNSVWTLTGTGTAATPWTIQQGTLQIGDGATVLGNIADNATLAFGNSSALTFANAVTGTGGVNQVGSGRTNLTGASTYTGPTTISGGTLAVNGSIVSAVTIQSGGTLGGNGTVGATTVQSGGTVAPGNSIGTIHINGAFVQNAGSVYQVEVDPTSNASDLILINGAATLQSGAGLNVTKNPAGDYRVGAQYTVLTASGGVTGSYAVMGDTAISQFLAVQEQQDANDIYLRVVQTSDPAIAAQTGNQTGVAGAVDSMPSGNPVTTGVLNSSSAAAARAAFDNLSGEALASARGALVSGSVLVRDTTFDRLRDVVCATGDDAGTADGHSACVRSDQPALWAQGFGSWGHISGNGNASGLTQSTGGFLIGADVPVYDWRVGYFGGFSRTAFDVTARDSWGTSDNYHLGAYAGTAWGDLGLRLGASYSWNNLATERSVTVGSLSNDLRASYDAGTTQIFGELGERFAVDTITLEPFANLAYVNLRTDGFRETGGDAALTARTNTQEDGFATLGVRPSATISWGGLDAILRGMAGWRHTFGDVTPSSIVSFANSNSFTIEGAPIARDAGVAEAGLDFNLPHSITAGLTYGGQFSSGETDHGIRGTFAIVF